MADWIDCAILVQAKGLEGGLVCRAAAGLPFLLHEGAECALVPPRFDAPRYVTVDTVELRSGHDDAVVTFCEVTDREVAEALAGCHCLMEAEAANLEAAVGELAADVWACEGFEVVDEQAGFIGIAEGLEEAPGQTRLVVARAGQNPVLVPLVEQIVMGVNASARRIDVCLPSGLLDL